MSVIVVAPNVIEGRRLARKQVQLHGGRMSDFAIISPRNANRAVRGLTCRYVVWGIKFEETPRPILEQITYALGGHPCRWCGALMFPTARRRLYALIELHESLCTSRTP